MIRIEGLCVSVEGNPILKGIDLDIESGQVHAIMGPNGSGKSTLSYALAGRDGYEITDGSITFAGQDMTEMAPEERAASGLFLAFQYPVEIPGVQVTTFLRTAVNAQRKARGEGDMDALEFLKLLKSKAKALGIDDAMLKRALNVGFSGGEKKRLEALQMAVLQPKFSVLDETDSGLDIDALRIVADNVNALRAPNRAFLVITHYQRLLEYIVPDRIHVLAGGRIVRSGDASLAVELERTGYAGLTGEAA